MAKKIREHSHSLRERVDRSLKRFDITLNNLQLEYNMFIYNSVETTIQILLDVGFFDFFKNKD